MKWILAGLLCLLALTSLFTETMVVHTQEQDYSFDVDDVNIITIFHDTNILSINTPDGDFDFHMLDDIISIDFEGTAVDPGLEEIGQHVPIQFLKNYPNPFNPETAIRFSTGVSAKVNLTIYNVKGQKVKTLINERLDQGEHSIKWQGTDEVGKKVGGGNYFYRLKVGDEVKTRKMLLLK